MRRDYDRCLNKAWVGEWREAKMDRKDAKGVAALSQIRKVHATRIGDELVAQLGVCVAVFTYTDPQQHRFWLAKPLEAPRLLGPRESATCASSGEQFGANERIIKVHWYQRVVGQPLVFHMREDLGEFLISCDMLRAGGSSEPIALIPREMLPPRAGNPAPRQVWDLGSESLDDITDAIENVCQDRDVE
jgi:hypothetical protein